MSSIFNNFVKAIAATEQTVLITGQTGSGKSRLALEIHMKSQRKDRKFITVNLPTLSENLIESELFGHERGAFSGADQKRIGRLEYGNGGTVFLDEVGELPLHLQAKLLEALNSKTITPLGSNREIQLDIRIIAATNRNLREMVKRGEFREDLFFRLNLFQVEMPSLAENADQLMPLARELAVAASQEQGKQYRGLSNEYEKALMGYSWPGNVRELKNAIAYGVALSLDGTLSPELLPPYIRLGKTPRPADDSDPTNLGNLFHLDYYESKKRFETLYLREVLKRQKGMINQTARVTGISKVTLIEKIRRYGIDVKEIKFRLYQQENKESEKNSAHV